MPNERSEDFRVIYSQVQVFAFSGSELVITFLRAEPKIKADAPAYVTGKATFVEEAIVYLPVAQAKTMCEKILEIIRQQEKPAKAKVN